MKINTNKTLLAGAAVAGILAGGLATNAKASSSSTLGQTSLNAGILADDSKGSTHDCKGQNSCKGKGGCKSGDNGCSGKNSCKGKGGCGMKDGKPNMPKAN